MNMENEDMDITLPLLQTIAERPDVTQRKLSERLSLALGLTNSYLKRCITKGLIKVEQMPANRYLYHLTSRGITKKTQLMSQQLTHSMQLFREVRSECETFYLFCRKHNLQNIALVGSNELAEIACLSANEYQFDLDKVSYNCQSLENYDAWILTDFKYAQSTYDRLTRNIDPNRICCFSILQVQA